VSLSPNLDTSQALDRASGKMVGLACSLVLLCTSLVLSGWIFADAWIIHFPFAARYGTMMPLSAVMLTMFAVSLLLLHPERTVTASRRRAAELIVSIPMIIGVLVLGEYAFRLNLGIDRILFPNTVNELVERLPGRPSPITAFSVIVLGFAFLSIDIKSKSIQRAGELLLLIVFMLALERCISYMYREVGAFAPRWRMRGHPLFHQMSPSIALCLIALCSGLVYARPHRRHGLIALFYSRGPGRLLARWLVPLAIIAPIGFGWLSMLVFRAGLRGAIMPLSFIVSAMIVTFLTVIALSARAVDRATAQRERAEAELAERERLQRAVFDNAGAGLVVVDIKGRPVATNKTLQAMVGYSAEELATMPFWRLTHPANEEENTRLYEQLVRGERDRYFIEARCTRRDGSDFACDLHTSVARDEDGQLEFVIGMLQDVTEREEAQEARKQLGAIIEATPDFVGISDPEGKAIYLNEAGRKIVGVNGDDISKLHIPDFHPDEDAQRVLNEGIPSAIRDGVWTGESQLKCRDGKLIPVSHVILAHKTDEGEVAYLSTIMRDITFRKRLQLAQQFLLDISRASTGSMDKGTILRSLVNLVVPRHADFCGIYLIAPDGHVEKMAIARAGAGGRTISETLRVYPHFKKPNPLIGEVARTDKAVIVPNVTDTELTLLFGNTGHLGMVKKFGIRSIMALPLRGRDRVLGVLCYIRTETKKPFEGHRVALAQEVAGRISLALDNAELLAQAQEATRIRDEVLRVVAHDLRNPLNTISLTADFLQQKPLVLDRAAWTDKLDIIMRSVTHADRLIEDLLDVARLQAGLLTVETTPTPASNLVEEVVVILKPVAEDRGIHLRAEKVPSGQFVQADTSRVMQVLSNLLGNAIKFSRVGGEVVLRVEPDGSKMRFSIEDHGPGIAAEDQEHLFDPFWQARRSQQGVGLGLPIAKAIVQAHGGSLWFETKRGVGSTFHFTLPIARSSSQTDSLAAD
jgi:PAS domain S-box-containing protein